MNDFSTRLVTPTGRTPLAPARRERALVLGGGGAAGNAWLIGVLAGLLDAGLDVRDSDLVIGTSAGATAAAQLAGADARRLFDEILAAPPVPPRGGVMLDHLQRTDAVIAESADADDMRRRLAASALALDAPADHSARWHAIVAARLPRAEWPEQETWLTAIDARTAEPVVVSAASGVGLVDAVAASTSGGFVYAIGDELYLDGGYRRSSENADLAAGAARVLVLSPLGGRTRAPLEWGLQLEAQVDELRAGGSAVECVLPDAAALDAFGPNLMDLSRRAPAARAGHAQGAAVAERLTAFWR